MYGGGAALVAAVLSFSPLAHGQGYSTTFDGYTTGSLSGQNGWDTNDPYVGTDTTGAPGSEIGQSDFVGIITGYSSTATDDWAYLGGLDRSSVVPGHSTVYVYNNFAATPLTGLSSYAFNVDMSVYPGGSPYTTLDQFAWTFGTAATPNLFSVNFVPNSNSVDAVRYSVNGGGLVTTGNGIVTNSIYHLTVNVNVVAKTFSISVTPTGGTALTLASNISLGTIDASTVTQVAATWTLANTAADASGGYSGAGSNSLIFNNYSVGAVPEPSTWALVGIGGLLLLAVRRRVRA